MNCKRRIIKSPLKEGNISHREAEEAVRRVREKFIKIGRIGKMELKINIDVEKVDNGFILFRDIYGIKLHTKFPEEGREIYVTFPEVRTRIIHLLKKIADDLELEQKEAILGKH